MSSTEFRTKIKHLRQKISKLPVVLDLIGGLAYLYAWLAGKTGKFDVSGIDEFEKLIADNDGGIFVAWHGRALMLPYFWRNPRQMKALVSPHNDGRIIARLLRGFNILSIDGSSYRKALPAALSIVHELEQGTVVALIPDGPRGPRMRLNKSVIYFAEDRQTGYGVYLQFGRGVDCQTELGRHAYSQAFCQRRRGGYTAVVCAARRNRGGNGTDAPCV